MFIPWSPRVFTIAETKEQLSKLGGADLWTRHHSTHPRLSSPTLSTVFSMAIQHCHNFPPLETPRPRGVSKPISTLQFLGLIRGDNPCRRCYSGRAFNSHPSTARLYSIPLDQLNQARELTHPCGTDILGTVNGVLCLCEADRELVLWNFATRKYQKVPPPGVDFEGRSVVGMVYGYGFGYDEVNDDYKLIRLVQLTGKRITSFKTEAKVYSLRSNSWRRIRDFPYFIHGSYGLQVCGCLHWLVTCRSKAGNLIAAFDLATNEYKVVDHPEVLKSVYGVIKLDERLCVPSFSPERADMWVMKDYGVKESWSKLYSISQPEVISFSELLVPLTYSRSGTEILLLQNNRKLLWYSLKEGNIRMISPRGCPDDFLPEVCVESLVPLNGEAEDYAKKKDGGAKEKLIKGVKKRDDFLSQGFKLKL